MASNQHGDAEPGHQVPPDRWRLRGIGDGSIRAELPIEVEDGAEVGLTRGPDGYPVGLGVRHPAQHAVIVAPPRRGLATQTG